MAVGLQASGVVWGLVQLGRGNSRWEGFSLRLPAALGNREAWPCYLLEEDRGL